MRKKLTARRIRELFDYESNDGRLIRRIQTAGNAPKGEAAGCLANHGYLVIRVDGKLYLAHRLVWLHVKGKWPQHGLDHLNMCRTDNRIENLREATSSQNKMNKRKSPNNTSGYKGVSWSSGRGKWLAQIKVQGKNTFLGYYDDPATAYEAYRKRAYEVHGEFARMD